MPLITDSITPYNQQVQQPSRPFLPDNVPLGQAIFGSEPNYNQPLQQYPQGPSAQDILAGIVHAMQAGQNNSQTALKQAFQQKGLSPDSKGDTFGTNEAWGADALNSLPIMPDATHHQGVKDFYNSLPIGSLYREATTKNGQQVPTGVVKRKVSDSIDNIGKDPSVTEGGVYGFLTGLANGAIGAPAKELGGLLSFSDLGKSIRDWGLARERASNADSGTGAFLGNLAGNIIPDIGVGVATSGYGVIPMLFAQGAGNSLAETTASNSNAAQNVENALIEGGGNALLGKLFPYMKMGDSLAKDVGKGALANLFVGTGSEEAKHLVDPQNTPNNVSMNEALMNAALGGALAGIPHAFPSTRAGILREPPPEQPTPSDIPLETRDLPQENSPTQNTEQTPFPPDMTRSEQPIQDNNIEEQVPQTQEEQPPVETAVEGQQVEPVNGKAIGGQNQTEENLPEVEDRDIPDYSDSSPLPRTVDEVLKNGDRPTYDNSMEVYKSVAAKINNDLDSMEIPKDVMPRVDVEGRSINEVRRNFNDSLEALSTRLEGPSFENAPQEVKDTLGRNIQLAHEIERARILPNLIHTYSRIIDEKLPQNRISEFGNAPNNLLMEIAKMDSKEGLDARIILQARRHINQLSSLDYVDNGNNGVVNINNTYQNNINKTAESPILDNLGIRPSSNPNRPLANADDEMVETLKGGDLPKHIQEAAQLEEAIRSPQQEHLDDSYDYLINNMKKLSNEDLKEIINTKGGDVHNPFMDTAKAITSDEINRRNNLTDEEIRTEEKARPKIVDC